MKKYALLAVTLAAILGFARAVHAEGHYQGGFTNIRDFVEPFKKGFVALTYNPFYWSGDYRDNGGDKIGSFSKSRTIEVGKRIAIETTATVENIDIDVMTYTLNPVFFYFTGIEVLGANYGVGVGPSYNYKQVKVSADITGTADIQGRHFSVAGSRTRHVEIEDTASGFGDLMVRPVMLDWSSDLYDIVLAYSFYSPTGSYKEGKLANAGLGYWSHDISFGGLLYFNKKATAILCNATYEFNTRKTGEDVYPGQNIILEYGISQYFATWFEVGVSGASYFQVTDTAGSGARNKDDKQMYHSVGGEVSIWPIPQTLGLVGRYFYQYYSENSLRGHGANASVIILF